MPFRAKRLARRIGNTLKTSSRKGYKTLNRAAVEQGKWQAATQNLSGMGIYSGFGKYTKKKRKRSSAPKAQGAVTNSLIAGSDVMIPSFTSAGDETGGITISRKEYLGDVFAPALDNGIIPAFANTTYSINPGVERSFPWLSQIAQNFEEYTLHQLIYTYRSTITDLGASLTGQCGTTVMCTTYNINNTPFEDKVTMMEYEGAMSSKCSDSMLHGVECDPEKLSGSPGKYVRANGFANGNLNGRDYDHGLFQIAVANAPKEYANQTIGELWVTYTVSLRKPKFFVGRGFGISQDIFINTPSSQQPRIEKGLPMGNAARQFLTGELNNLRTQLQPVFTGAQPGTAGYEKRLNDIQAITVYANFTNALKITFPGSVTGYFEIAVFMKMRNTSSQNPGGHVWSGSQSFGNNYWLSPDATQFTTGVGALNGNINYVKDIYAGMPGVYGANTNTQPTSYEAVPIAGQSNGYFRVHIFVRPASNGQENFILLPINSTALQLVQEGTSTTNANDGSIMSCTLTVTEYNAAFSYRANNIGPEAPGTQSVDNIYIDSTGTRIVPWQRT